MFLDKFVRLFWGDTRMRNFKRVKPLIDKVNEWDEQFNTLTDEELTAKTGEFRERLEQGTALDDLLPEAFAAVKQACRRLCGQSWEAGGSEVTWNMVPYDVQLCGAIYLHQGNIAEMATGEGKTLVAPLALYLNALEGKGAHLVTVNDYLARRDAEWMTPIYNMLGMSCGVILANMNPEERRQSYRCDITYGTNNEFGFDYLRDNMAWHPDYLVQSGFHYAIVDEVDSVLIDEARTPLIISGQVDRSTQMYDQIKPMVARLVQVQNKLVNDFVGEAEVLLKEAEEANDQDKRYEVGRKLLIARLGSPKHRRLMKLISSEASVTRLIDRVERDYMIDKRMPELEEELFFAVDEKSHQVNLTEKGRVTINPNNPDQFLLPDIVAEFSAIEGDDELTEEQKAEQKELVMANHDQRSEELHNMSQLFRAYILYEKDRDYVIQDGKVNIVDEFTGRVMEGRRWSDGLHQAVEAKENVTIQKETQTLATITLQNFFRMYSKLAGMTGTAETEAAEFAHTYEMNVAVIPTHRPLARVDHEDLIYKTQREKYNAIIEEIKRLHGVGLPVLVGTASVEVSEKVSRMLERQRISHNVLNAKQHEREAHVVAEAGKKGAVTIATNMAGRGTDIKLGEGVLNGEFGDEFVPGLQIIGTERHESRRIDRQLRGRAGRQGDPGTSRFFVSLEDDLMRLFASEKMASLISKGMVEGEAIQHVIATKALGSAQKRIEGINFEQRKRTLDYDNVMNRQREEVYGMRRRALVTEKEMHADEVLDFTADTLSTEWSLYSEGSDDQWDIEGFEAWLRRCVPFMDFEDMPRPVTADNQADYLNEILERCTKAYAYKAEMLGGELMAAMARVVILQVIDNRWRDHLLAIDQLREGIGLQGYGQKDPLVEYQREASLMFQELMMDIRKEVFEKIYRATIVREQTSEGSTSRLSFEKEEGRQGTLETAQRVAAEQQSKASAAGDAASSEGKPVRPQTVRRTQPKIGPNEPCPCGSGKKFKKCCGIRQQV